MSVINREKLPFVRMSHEFVGEKHDVNISFSLVNAPPGRRPDLHRHDYDEIIIVQDERATSVAGDEQRDMKAGDIIVIPGRTPHWWSSLDSDINYLIYRPDPDGRLALK